MEPNDTAKAVRETEIGSAMGSLKRNIEKLGETIGQLKARIEPIMNLQEKTLQDGTKVPESIPSSALANAIHMEIKNISGLTEILRDINSRIEI
jgi:hypothetical protein